MALWRVGMKKQGIKDEVSTVAVDASSTAEQHEKADDR